MMPFATTTEHGPRLRITTRNGRHCLDIDNSALQNYTACNRRWFFSSVLRRGSVNRSSALGFGSAMHEALEKLNWFNFKNQHDDWPKWFANECENIYRKHLSPCRFGEKDHRTFDNFFALCVGYFNSHPIAPEYIVSSNGEPLIEVPFEVFLRTYKLPAHTMVRTDDGTVVQLPYGTEIDIYLIGRIDYAFWNGEYPAIADFKSASGNFTTPAEYGTVTQFKGYGYAMRKLFSMTPTTALIHQCICTKGGKLEFADIPVMLNDTILDDYEFNLLQIVDSIWVNATAIWPNGYPANYNSCHNKFGVCPFKNACEWTDSSTRNQVLNSELFADDNWDPRHETD